MPNGNDMQRVHMEPHHPVQDRIASSYYRYYTAFQKAVYTNVFRIKSVLLGVRYGANLCCWGPVHIVRHPGSHIVIGDNVSIVSDSYRCSASSLYAPTKMRTFSPHSLIRIGNNVGLNGTSIISRSRHVIIGDNTMIAPNVTILDSDFHALWPPETRLMKPDFESDADVLIGENVWIGMQSIILKGATIGKNSVIGAGSIVTGNIPENMLAAGSPARVIRSIVEP
ncbi:MAG: transferase hexapeptide repeat containing [Desulfovibrionaceae bacterium]|nr:MAG: transferase hexapeptide repeat containing [Desulfovibrionaceae bacterium]